nr:hypothetical protein [Tanacetum cinerariifolium]
MAMLSLRINKFQKKEGRKINFNNKDSARFKRRKTEEAEQVYSLMAGFKSDFAVPAGSVNPAAAEFAIMGISPKNGNSKKSLGRDSKGGIIILSPVSFEEHVVVQRETKARTFYFSLFLEITWLTSII